MPALSAARGDSGALEHAAFLEGDEAVVAEDDVVEELDAEELAALVEALGDAVLTNMLSSLHESCVSNIHGTNEDDRAIRRLSCGLLPPCWR
jgi:hypothetical protein